MSYRSRGQKMYDDCPAVVVPDLTSAYLSNALKYGFGLVPSKSSGILGNNVGGF
jgi:hypothetical protein